jgi:hypothetical protein
MKIKPLLSFLLLAQLAWGQSEKHIQVAGTKCSLIPPVGFVPATSFSGFQQAATGSSIMINELPGPYQSIVDGFTADALQSRGMKLQSKQTIDFNNSKATLLMVTQAANGNSYSKQILIFGDSKNTVLVNGIYPEAAKAMEASMKAALLSTVYSASQNDNPQDAAAFTIDANGTDFKLAKYISGSLIYSTDGKVPTEKATFIVGSSVSKIPAPNQKKYAEDRIKKLPRGDQNVIKEMKAISIDRMNGYEIMAEGISKDGKPEFIYQVMIFNEQGDYYIMLGQAREEVEKNVAAFKKMASTFKRK